MGPVMIGQWFVLLEPGPTRDRCSLRSLFWEIGNVCWKCALSRITAVIRTASPKRSPGMRFPGRSRVKVERVEKRDAEACTERSTGHATGGQEVPKRQPAGHVP